MSGMTQETARWWRRLVRPIFLAMHRHGIGEIKIAKRGTKCVFELSPEGGGRVDGSDLIDGVDPIIEHRDFVESAALFGIWMDAEKQKPKVGQKVIVCGHWSNGNRWRTIATWQPAGSIDASGWDEAPEAWWDEDGNVCTNPNDEWSETPVEGERSYGLENVTHWMPLPDMPNDPAMARRAGESNQTDG